VAHRATQRSSHEEGRRAPAHAQRQLRVEKVPEIDKKILVSQKAFGVAIVLALNKCRRLLQASGEERR
jgi:hypothetical protein